MSITHKPLKMGTSDFYEILGISKNATTEEIRKAYIKAILKWHPDKNPDPSAKEKFNNIQIAYENLSNKQKRIRYDAFDGIKHSSKIKDIYLYFCLVSKEIFEKYEIAEADREEFDLLFDVSQFEQELESNDIQALYEKIAEKMWNFAPKVIMKKLSQQNPLLGILFHGLPRLWNDDSDE
jgi:DnaJ-class molecular chaperone